jgi:hypothetical protein
MKFKEVSESVINNKGWVSLLRLLDEGGFKNMLIPHEIINDRYIQYDLNGYEELKRFSSIKFNNIINYLRRNGYGFLYGSIHKLIKYYSRDDKIYLWFNIEYDLKDNVLGAGGYNYVHGIGDNKVRKVAYNETPSGTLFYDMPYLSKMYPDYFVKTTLTKSGSIIQDKVTLVDYKITNKLAPDFYYDYPFTIPEEDMYEMLKQFLINKYGDTSDLDKLFSFLLVYVSLEKSVNDILKTDSHIISKYESGEFPMIDLHYDNVGYDKDGKLKVIDI